MKKLFLIIVFATVCIYSQSVIIKGKSGLTFSGISSYTFSKYESSRTKPGNNTISLLPDYLIGIEIETNDLFNIEDTYLNFALEFSYGQSTTGEVSTSVGEAEFETSTSPILFWTTIKTKGKIIPFLRLGLGTENARFAESYKSYPQYNFELKDWFFCWAIGGGLEFNYFQNVHISLFVEWVARENGIYKILDDRRIINFDFRNGNTLLGIQFGYML